MKSLTTAGKLRVDDWTAFAIFLLVLLWVVPVILNLGFITYVVTLTNIFAILAISWNLLSGYVGLLSLGHSFFLGIAGYGYALAAIQLRLPLPIALLAGAALASLFGLAIALPSLKLKGHYFALLTLLVPIVVAKFTAATPQLGGHDGIFGIPPLARDQWTLFHLSFLLLGIAIVVSQLVDRTRIGLISRAIREDDVAAMAAGVNVPRYKMLMMTLSGFIAGLAGAFYASFIGVMSPSIYELEKASLPLIMSVMGGHGTVAGPIIGAYLIQGVLESLRIEEIVRARLLVYAAIAFVLYYFSPSGIVGLAKKIRERL